MPRWSAPRLPVYIGYPQARFYPAKLRKFAELMQRAFGASRSSSPP